MEPVYRIFPVLTSNLTRNFRNLRLRGRMRRHVRRVSVVTGDTVSPGAPDRLVARMA